MGLFSINKQISKAISSLTEDPMVTFVGKEFLRYEQACSDRFEKAQKIVDQWNNKPPRKDKTWNNAVHVPITFASEQIITPRIFAALFPTDAPLDVCVYGNATNEQGIKIKTALQHYFKLANVQGESISTLTQNTLLGTGYVEAPYLYKTGWQVGQDGQRYKAVLERRPDCKSVNFFEVFPHPAKLSVDDGLPLIRRRYVDAEYIKAMASNPAAKFTKLKEALDSDLSEPRKDIEQNMSDKRKRDEYELLEYWGPWDDTYEKDNEVTQRIAVPYWIQVINRKVLVRGVENPYNFQHAPYCKINMFPADKPSWWGVGTGQAGMPTQDRLNKIVNQRLDNVDLVMNKQGCYNGNDPLINAKKLQVSQPGLWHAVSDTVSSLKWMDTPDVTASSYKEEELAKADYREATGASSPLMPTDQNQHDTASGLNLLQGAAGIRFRPVLKKIETDFIADLASMFLSNLQQFMNAPEWMQLVTDDGRSQPILITPEELQGKATIIPTGISETLNKETQIAQLLRFKEISVNDPTVNQAELNKEIAGLMGFKDIHKFIVNQQPVQVGAGLPTAAEQMIIQKRLAEGASPEQIKLELLGQHPGEQGGGGQGGPAGQNPAPKGQQPGPGVPPPGPMAHTGPVANMPGAMRRQ